MAGRSIIVRTATADDHQAVTSLVLRLLSELYDPEEYGYSVSTLGPAARELLREGSGYWGFLACTSRGEAVGVLTLNECRAIYAFGCFGEIAELYVAPEYRRAGVGALLVQKAIEFARSRGWSVLEVGTPELPRWQRTFDFYLRSGFSPVGPRLTLYLSGRS